MKVGDMIEVLRSLPPEMEIKWDDTNCGGSLVRSVFLYCQDGYNTEFSRGDAVYISPDSVPHNGSSVVEAGMLYNWDGNEVRKGLPTFDTEKYKSDEEYHAFWDNLIAHDIRVSVGGTEESEIMDLLEGAFLQLTYCDEDGWHDTMAISVTRDIGDYLVTTGKWEKQEGGFGRRQFYRVKQ